MTSVEATGLIQSSIQTGSSATSVAVEGSPGSSVAQSPPLNPYVFDVSRYFQRRGAQVSESTTGSESHEASMISGRRSESRKRRVDEEDEEEEEGGEEARRRKKVVTVTGRSSSGSGPSQHAVCTR
ncbi:hypothetical protein BGX20_008480 [Mortierella sp. AD010]|nr:hypothetical protein BGX20_008480 [Mortierella sp. AD010]